ncbi:enoyl-CoA hydratase/isomerase family protein [Salibaculum sp.]|uniref:enoyl-CoA hydratase/isomerase family protein n=1 Tax=Salibaculum sp. TaxID=2855480 RepID=UPI002B464E26|nr:enoyl-CoA hydratase/isomerase family protein [Salibaculum sp.]HKL69925.1 enoyl-CoA hydratase/isomerase family protein [Salibaculum sp.]
MIRVESEGDVLTLTLNRPEKANALTETMLTELSGAVGEARERVLVLTGAGNIFSAGADLDEVEGGTLAHSPQWERLSWAVAEFRGLSIAALNGTVAGGAMGMVLACDLRLCVPGAKFFYPVMKLGHLPQPTDPRRLSALVGPARAKLILMGGQKIVSDDAFAFGLLDRVCDAPVEEARAIAADVLAARADHVTAIKGMIC